jgi:hypothetical protein
MPFEPGREPTDGAMHLRVLSNDLRLILTEENGMRRPLSRAENTVLTTLLAHIARPGASGSFGLGHHFTPPTDSR